MKDRENLYKMAADINDMSSKDDIRYLRNICDERIRSISNMLKYDLAPGDKVSIDSKRHKEGGIVEKINRTRAVVLIEGKQWNVPFSLISK